MIVDPRYGPQFDPRDGTVGDTKLVLRYALVHKRAEPGPWVWPAQQGQYTYATEEEAAAQLAQVRSSNSTERFPELATLRVAAVWCWPGHFDPCHAVNITDS